MKNRLLLNSGLLFLAAMLCGSAFAESSWNPGTKVPAGQFIAGPTTGASAGAKPRAIVAGDIGGAMVWKNPVELVATTNQSKTVALTTYDGIGPVTSGVSRILLTGQTALSENGIWIWNGGGAALTRPTDYAAASTTNASYFSAVLVLKGNTLPGTVWYITTTGAITIDSTNVTWTQWTTTNKYVATSTSPYNATAFDDTIAVDATGGAKTVTFPVALSVTGKKFTVLKTDSSANAVTIDPNASETINGGTTTLISKQGGYIVVQSDGANWQTIGGAGDYLVSTQFVATSAPTTAQYGSAATDAVQVVLSPGEWDLSVVVDFILNGATCTSVSAGIGTATGNNSAGLQTGDNLISSAPPTANYDTNIVIPSWRVVVTATTTYYLKIFTNYSAGTPQWKARLSARRIR